MQVEITLKSPDAGYCALEDFKDRLPSDLGEEEREELIERADAAIESVLRDGEYLSVEVDIETREAKIR
jgi:hypothetical protein